MEFAILAPVPREHLDSGLKVLLERGYVSFGSQKWELFHHVEQLRHDEEVEEVPVLIYPAHEEEDVTLNCQVSWIAWYVGCTEDPVEKLADQTNGYRPPTTEKYYSVGEHAESWNVFWRVKRLRQLPESEWVPIRSIDSYKTGYWRKNTAPHGPEIVGRPSWI